MKKQRTAILYARVTKAEHLENPADLKRQIRMLTNYCRRCDIRIIDGFSEVATGRHFRRKQFQSLLTKLKTGLLKADLLLMTGWDRYVLYPEPCYQMTEQLILLGIKPKAMLATKCEDELYESILESIILKKNETNKTKN